MSKPKAKTNDPSFIDPSTLYITDEPFTESRPAPASKYEAIFSKLQKNQRLVCATGQAARVSQGLRNWLARRGHEAAVVRSKERCDDGKGGVWWLDGERAEQRLCHTEPAEPAERPSRVKTTLASAAPAAPAPGTGTDTSAAPVAPPAPGTVAKASAAPGSPFAILDRKRKP